MPESKVHSFIVKLWLDDAEQRKGKGGWHGYVTHVPSGERRYLKELQDIVFFIRSYVGDIDGSFISHVRRWLKSGTGK